MNIDQVVILRLPSFILGLVNTTSEIYFYSTSILQMTLLRFLGLKETGLNKLKTYLIMRLIFVEINICKVMRQLPLSIHRIISLFTDEKITWWSKDCTQYYFRCTSTDIPVVSSLVDIHSLLSMKHFILILHLLNHSN